MCILNLFHVRQYLRGFSFLSLLPAREYFINPPHHRYQRQLLALNDAHPFWSAEKLAATLHERAMKALLDRPSGAVIEVPFRPGRERIRQILRKAGTKSFRGSRKPLLTSRHIRDRLQFATAHQDFDFNKVVFSDEKIFRIRPGAVSVRCWRRKGENRFKAKYTIPTTAKSEGIMVWAAMDSAGKVIVCRCPKKVNAAAYQACIPTPHVCW